MTAAWGLTAANAHITALAMVPALSFHRSLCPTGFQMCTVMACSPEVLDACATRAGRALIARCGHAPMSVQATVHVLKMVLAIVTRTGEEKIARLLGARTIATTVAHAWAVRAAYAILGTMVWIVVCQHARAIARAEASVCDLQDSSMTTKCTRTTRRKDTRPASTTPFLHVCATMDGEEMTALRCHVR